MTKVEKIILKGWRPSGAQLISNVLRRNSQIGQLLYYLTAVQLKQIQHALSPEQRICRPQNTCKTLGLFIEGGKVGNRVRCVCVLLSLAGPDLPGEGRSGRYCQHSVDGAGMLARP